MKTGSGEPTNRGTVCWNPLSKKRLTLPSSGQTVKQHFSCCLVQILRSLNSCDLDQHRCVFIEQNGVSFSLKTTTNVQLTCYLEIGPLNSVQFISNNFIYPVGAINLRAALRKKQQKQTEHRNVELAFLSSLNLSIIGGLWGFFCF